MSQPRQPPVPPIKQATTPEQEAEKRAQNCLAKAAYCKWVASITADKTLKDLYVRLSTEWQKEAEGEHAK
jgi:hypothetical protein